MQVVSSRSSSIGGKQTAVYGAKNLLSLYQECPEAEIALDDFERLASNRLCMLRQIEQLRAKGLNDSDPEYSIRLKESEKKYIPLRTLADSADDRVGHFILRLAYCRTEDLRHWFLQQECYLLRFRLESMSNSDRADFMAANGIIFEQLESNEMNDLRDKLIGQARVTEANFSSIKFYKIPFLQALQLVANREVYLQDGYAFVPLTRLVETIINRFRVSLSRALAEATNKFGIVTEDNRIGPLLKNMNKQYVGNDFSMLESSEKLSADKVQYVAEHNMPLCMKYLQSNLKRDHKLKHWGRLQYGLFLKGAGLDLEQANIFWESMFTKIMAREEFVKKYAYSFRHMYGKEGARKNYTPFSCMKIIMGSPPEIGAYHGCPYRHSGDQQLTALIGSLHLNPSDSSEILRLAKDHHYQLACSKHFEATHEGYQTMNIRAADAVSSHPNQWFAASREYHKIKNGDIVVEKTSEAEVPTIGSSSLPSDSVPDSESVPMEM